MASSLARQESGGLGTVESVSEEQRVVSAGRVIEAPAEVVFELIADPSRQPSWDGNDNLGSAEPGQRVREVGDVFTMTLSGGKVRQNHVVEFDEGRRIAWRPPRSAPNRRDTCGGGCSSRATTAARW